MNHSGRFELLADAGAIAPTELAELWTVVESFGKALAAGYFEPAKLISSTRGNRDVLLLVEANDVPEYAFSVLSGMLARFSAVVHPLVGYRATLVGAPPVNLCKTTEPWPQPAPRYPFSISSAPGLEHTTPPLSIEIELSSTPDEKTKAELKQQLLIFHQLLQGGYPSPDFALGESGTSQPSIRFDAPRLLRYHVDMWSSSEDAFVALYNQLTRWKSLGAAVDSVDIYS